MLNDVYRKRPKSSAKCTAENLFIFNWQSLCESQQHKSLPVEKSVLRAYLKVIPRLLNRKGPTNVNMDVYMRRPGSTTRVHAGEMALQVTATSAGWVEMNVTKGVRSLWPLTKNDSFVEISIVLKSNCVKRSPVVFEDPSAISLSQMKRRQRLSALQPLFLVYISDEAVKETVRNETMLSSEEYENYNDDVEGDSSEGVRQRRSADSACQVSDFQVKFADLDLDYILVPTSYNARQCKGSCSHRTVSKNGYLANNHAKLLASASLLAESKPELFRVQPEAPCCVPSQYASMTVIVQRPGGSLKYVMYSHMVVKECRCR